MMHDHVFSKRYQGCFTTDDSILFYFFFHIKAHLELGGFALGGSGFLEALLHTIFLFSLTNQ